MSEFVYARSFRDLTVYQKSFALAKRVFVLLKDFPKEEWFSLTDQIRRSSRSVGAHIAEVYAVLFCSATRMEELGPVYRSEPDPELDGFDE